MRAALDSMEDPILHLAVHLTLVGALREGEVAGLTPEDIDFDAANGIGTFTVNRSMQRVQKDTLAQVDKGCILRIVADKLEGQQDLPRLKDTKTEASCRTIFMTAALRGLKQWLERLETGRSPRPGAVPQQRDAAATAQRSGGGAGAHPQKFLKWQDAHPEFPRIVFHGLRHSSATYQLMMLRRRHQGGAGDCTGHASADMLVNTYAHIQQSSRVELGKKFESGFYAKPGTPSPAGCTRRRRTHHSP
ncbi:MAG: hypothetical protein ACLVJH_01960 [Faecalibacterium prausnitzii]